MIRYLIKNNFRLMFRNKWIIFIMILGPIFVIAILSSAFEDLMQSYERAESFSVGYRISNESILGGSMKEIKEEGEKQGIILYEYPEGNPEELIRKNDLAGFVCIEDDSYSVYENDKDAVEGITLEYFFGRVMEEAGRSYLNVMTNEAESETIELSIENIEFMPAISAKNYYAIVYIVYFIWCGIICIASVLSSEKKNRIENRFVVSGLSSFRLYIAKLVPAILTTICEITITIGILTIISDIEWGSSLLVMTGIALLNIVAASAFGLMIYYIFKNIAITVIIVFTTVWFMGFVGGSFETYMFSRIPETIKLMSPMYYVNRTLVEYSCMGKSDYIGSCIICLCIITVFCTVVSILAEHIRKKVRG